MKRKVYVELPNVKGYYIKDIGEEKENLFKIIIQEKGKFEHREVLKPITEESFEYKYKDKIYKIKQENLHPVDTSLFEIIKEKLLAIISFGKIKNKINHTYKIYFREDNQEAIDFPTPERIAGSLLYTVFNNDTTQPMLKSMLKPEGGGFKLNFKIIIVGFFVVMGVIIALDYFGIINLIPGIP